MFVTLVDVYKETDDFFIVENEKRSDIGDGKP